MLTDRTNKVVSGVVSGNTWHNPRAPHIHAAHWLSRVPRGSVTYRRNGEEAVDEDDKSQLLQAVNTLIAGSNASELYGVLMEVSPSYNKYPDYVSLIGDAWVLLPLLKLRRKNAESFQKVLGLIEERRRKSGLDSLQKPYDKTHYMRDFMDMKRQRQRRAVLIENMLRPPKDALKGLARQKFCEEQSARWKKELDARIDAARAALPHLDGQIARLPIETMTEIRRAFWEKVDYDMSRMEEIARREQLISGRANKKAAGLSDLQKALEHDPYQK